MNIGGNKSSSLLKIFFRGVENSSQGLTLF
jgi:hypothetical protein